MQAGLYPSATRKVWTPYARKVELVTGNTSLAMSADGAGWFQLSDAPAGDYGFRVDNGITVPDPRSPWQPHGVHGLSRPVDHSQFGWTDSAFIATPLTAAVLYEMHIGTFTPEGTFDSAISRLSHLCRLGITHVEIMPVAQFSGECGWGYDGVDLYAPHQAYGGPDGLKRFVDACHGHGLAVILDVVYNHLGPSGNYLGQFGPYFTNRYRTPWGEAMNFDSAGSDDVRRYIVDNAVMWRRDYHIDGLRLDAVHAIYDASPRHILEEIGTALHALDGCVIAESDLNDPRLLRGPALGGYGLDAQWSDDFHHALHTVLTGESNGYYRDFGRMADLAKAIEKVFVYDGRYSEFRQRRHGASPRGIPHKSFVVCLQNHDQVGNRAQGDRSSHLMSIDRLKIGAALVLLSPCIPMLFQGEEWAASTPFLYFTSHDDEGLARAVSEGRRSEFREFGWAPEEVPDPQAPSSFERSKLRWEESETGVHREMLEWHRSLIALRKELSSDGPVSCAFDEQRRWLVMHNGLVSVAVNLGTEAVRVTGLDGRSMRLASRPEITGPILPPDSVAVYLQP